MNTNTQTTGHCYCGDITFETTSDPIEVGHCHCESCRRHSGASMLTYAGYKPDQLLFTNKQPSKFETDDGVTRGFCSRCGSSVFYEGSKTDFIFIYIGLFDKPEELKPEIHMMISEKIEWLKLDDNLPTSNELPY